MKRQPAGGVGAPLPHDSAHLHVTGEAVYTDDIPEVRGTLHAAIGMSERAHARIKSIDLTRVRAAPGVVAVLTAKDVPGKNDYGPVVADDPIFATTLVAVLRPVDLRGRGADRRRGTARGAARRGRVRGPEADPHGRGRRARRHVRAADRADAAGRSRRGDRRGAAPAVRSDQDRRAGAVLSRGDGRVRGAEGGRRRCWSTARRSIRARSSTRSRTRSTSTRTTSSSNAGGWAAASAARRASRGCSRASRRCSRRSSSVR